MWSPFLKGLNSKRAKSLFIHVCWSEMTLKYEVIVERYPFSSGVVGGSIHVVKSSPYLREKDYCS